MHADRHEEQTQQKPLERFDMRFKLVAKFRLGKQYAGEKGAQTHRQAY